jgi:hypothetical protein
MTALEFDVLRALAGDIFRVSPFRQSLLAKGHGEWEFRVVGETVEATRVAKVEPLTLVTLKAAAIFIATLQILLSTPAAAADAIAARTVIPKHKRSIEVYVTVPPAPDNRGYVVALACDGEAIASTYRQLDGSASRGPFQPVVFAQLRDGVYRVSVVLVGSRGLLASAKPQIVRIGFGKAPDLFSEAQP